jgi:hypothetical protein
MNNEPTIGKVDALNFVEGVDCMPGPVTPKEFQALKAKLLHMFHSYAQNNGDYPNVFILSNRQWFALRKFASIVDIEPLMTPAGRVTPNFRGIKIIVDGRGDYPNTPLVGRIEF